MLRAIVAIGTFVGVAVVLCSAFWAGRQTSKPTRQWQPVADARTSLEQARPSATARPAAPAVIPASASIAIASPRAPAPPDEASVMSTLRALGDSEPARSLQLASEATRRFPGSPNAPEQAWYVCKSLVNLERFYDAREQARLMVKEYPETPWAEDVARHLLVNPLDLPGDPAR